MNDESRNVKSIFGRAIEIELPAERDAFLEEACDGRDDLRAEVDELLRAFGRAGNLLEDPPHQTPETLEYGACHEAPGATVGPYKLLEQIGEGGFGVVYMAEQEKPIRRRVALKIIKPGMDTKEVIARFEAERQALALMEHPNIARVLDAGTTEAGRPYFVMELVKGIPITEYCDRASLTAGERLELFTSVCHAVHHAHQRGIIHRDLKPSNILVTQHDGTPVVKVIDFGVAKAVNQRLTEKTLFTSFNQMVGTPLYMSPEQAELSGLDVDTRTDVYSLGVVLYELLTGSTPFDKQRLQKAAFDEVRRIIREEEPVRPSTKISTLGEKASTVSLHRRTDPRRLRALVRGDLDWIVMKALEKDRNRRYETAKDFAADIQRYVNHEAVEASPPSTVYRLRKFLRRNRMGVGIAAILGLVACAAMLVVWSNHRHETIARKQEEIRAKLPEISSLIDAGELVTAFKLLGEADEWIPGDAVLQGLWPKASLTASVHTEPEGAAIAIKNWRATESEWIPLGKSPLVNVRVPRGPLRWQISKSGYLTVESLHTIPEQGEFRVSLDAESAEYQGMVHVRRPEDRFDFFIDKFEVTNAQYARFVEDGGYGKEELWREMCEELKEKDQWKSVLKEFVDKTGKPGPATWRDGKFPPGQGDYPVSGVSWYEAAAYARYVGKELPTVMHWETAAGLSDTSQIVPLSNFSGDRIVPAGQYQGIGYFGAYDMAGNVKEWCWNAGSDGTRFPMGGAYSEPTYMFGRDRLLPRSRSETVGFRCVRYRTLPTSEDLETIAVPTTVLDAKPLTAEEFATAKKIFQYNRKAPLNPKTVSVDDSQNDYVHETVEVDAAYAGDRLILHLFLPRSTKPPYQTLICFPGAGARRGDRFSDAVQSGDFKWLTAFVKLGRAVCWPIYVGTYDRRGSWPEEVQQSQNREYTIRLVQDLARSLDYLGSRPQDFDQEAITYIGYSWGAILGPMMSALDERFDGCVLAAGGGTTNQVQELSPMSYAAHVKAPVLMLNGEQDASFPIETRVKPLLEAMTGTEDKHLEVFAGAGHALPLDGFVPYTDRWLNKRFGPSLGDVVATDASQEDLLRFERRAATYVQNKLFGEARNLYDQILQVRKSKLGEEHRDTLRTRFLVAEMLKAEDQLEHAVALYHAVLADQAKYFGKHDPDSQKTAQSFANFSSGRAWNLALPAGQPASQYAEAVSLFRKAVEAGNTLGKYTRSGLALALYRTGDMAAAHQANRESAQLDAASVSTCLSFAMIYWRQGNKALARDWYYAACAWIDRANITLKPLLTLREEARTLLGMPATNGDVSRGVYDRILADCPRGALTAEIHRRRGKLEAAEADVTVVLELNPIPDLVHLWLSRGELRVSSARWADAEADYSKAIQLAPNDQWSRYCLAPLRLFLGDETGYRNLCRETLERWRDTEEANLAWRTAFICCVLPPVDEELRPIVALADRAVNLAPQVPATLLSKGMAHYRSGFFSGALDSLTSAIAKYRGQFPAPEAIANSFCAMAQARQGRSDEASVSMLKARSLVCSQGASVRCGHFRGPWHEWMAAFSVFQEALQVVEGKQPAEAKAELQRLLQPGSDGLTQATECLTKLLARPSADLGLLRQRADLLARQGRWSEAAKDFSLLLKRFPTDSSLWLWLAPVLLETDVASYVNHCANMRERFKMPADWFNFGRAVQTTLLSTDAGVDWNDFSRLAEENAKKASQSPVRGHRTASAGLACYRAGRFEDALKYLEWAQETIDQRADSCKALFVLAMTYQKLDHPEDAGKCLELAKKVVPLVFPTADAGDLGATWNDWLICEILRREAEECLGTGPEKAASSGTGESEVKGTAVVGDST